MADALPVQHTALAELLSDLSRQFLRSASSRSGSQPGEPQLPGDQAELLERICTAHHQQEHIADAVAESPEAHGLKQAVAGRQRTLDCLLEGLEIPLRNASDAIQSALHVGSQRSATDLADSVDRNTPAEVPDHCKQRPTLEGVTRTLALAHRLSYTSFAPPGYEPGVTQLGNFRPPAPQEWQMRSAQLHQFAEEVMLEERRQQLPTAVGPAAQPPAPAPQQLVPSQISSIPQMPPGWKPGDPVGVEVEAPTFQTPAGEKPEAASAAPPARPLVDASEFLLDFDDEEAVSEEVSSEYSSDSD